MKVVYLRECYKHKWILDYVSYRMDEVSYQVDNLELLENRVFYYIGRYLLQDRDNYKKKNFIRHLVMKIIKGSLPLYKGIKSDHLAGSLDDEESGVALVDYGNNLLETSQDIRLWIDTLGGENPKHRLIIAAIAAGYTIDETALILTQKYGGKFEGNKSTIKRFRKKCRDNKKELYLALCL